MYEYLCAPIFFYMNYELHKVFTYDSDILYSNRRVGIGTGMRAISRNDVAPFLSIARNYWWAVRHFLSLRATTQHRL